NIRVRHSIIIVRLFDSAKQQRATTNSPKTPVNQRARSTTPATPTTSAKNNPLQVVSGEQPQGFERTKVSYFFFEALYLHIKVLWGVSQARTRLKTLSPILGGPIWLQLTKLKHSEMPG
ncbi:hypothetical protein VP01_1913g2, partial [Puccinia sorghi]